MRHSLGSRLTASAAALLLTFGHAYGQQQEITAQDAEAHFRQIQQEAVEIMRSGDFARLENWIETNIADGSVFQASMTVQRNGQRKGFAEITLDKDDMLRMGALFAGAVQEQVIGDYGLEVAVIEVIPQGAGAATATVRWTERLNIQAGSADDEEAQPGQQRRTVSVEAVASCTHLLRRMDGALALGLTTCSGEVRL